MRKIYSIFLMLLALTSMSAMAQDFSATVSWDTPGSIRVLMGSSPNYATEVSISVDATSYTVTEKQEYLFLPADGYYIDKATMEGKNQNLTKNWSNGGYYYKLPAQYQSSQFNGKTVELTMAQLTVAGEITIDIANGADKIDFQLQDAQGGLTHAITPGNGSNSYKIYDNDKKLYFKPKAYPVPALYTATNNGTPIEQATNGSYTTDIEPGALINLAFDDPAQVSAPVEVKFVFTNNNPECISNIRNWLLSTFIMPDALAAANYTLSVDKGTTLSINFDEDYTLNSISTTASVEPAATPIVGGTKFTILDDATITIDATGNVYIPQNATVYTNYIDGLTFTQEYDEPSTALATTAGAQHAASTVEFDKVGYTIPIATTEYTVENISGKTKKFFFAAKPGYWIAEGALANITKEAGDPADYYMIHGASMAFTDNCPLYLNVQAIDYDTPAVVYFESMGGCSARLTSKTYIGESAPYEGQLAELPEGEYSSFSFDPDFNATFSARFTVTDLTSRGKYYTYVDGVAQPASEDSDALFEGLKLGTNSVVKMFYAMKAPAKHILNFTVEDGATASLTYDKIVTVTDFSLPVSNIGTVTYKFAPGADTQILVGGTPLEAPYEFTPTDAETQISLVKKVDTTKFAWSFTPANGSDKNPLPGEDDQYLYVTLSLPEATTLSSDPYDAEGAVGPWLFYDGQPIRRGTDTTEGEWEYVADSDPATIKIAIKASRINLPGSLTIRAEEGAFTVNGIAPSPALEYEAGYGEKINYTVTVTPTPNTTLTADQIRVITMTFEEAESLALNPEGYDLMFAKGLTDGIYITGDDIAINGNTVTVTLPETYTPKYGLYALGVDEGSFIIDGKQKSGKYTFMWTIERTDPISFDWKPSPNIDFVNQGYGIEVAFIFGDLETVKVNNKNSFIVKFNGETLGAKNLWDDKAGFSVNGSNDMPNALMITAAGGELYNPETTGELSVTIPAGAISVSGQRTPEDISYTWKVVKAREYTTVITPANGSKVAKISTITIEFPEAETAAIATTTDGYEYGIGFMSLRDSGYSFYESAKTVTPVANAEHPTFDVAFATEATAIGSYTFKMNKGAFIIDGAHESSEISITIEVDGLEGVDGVGADVSSTITVVTLDGRTLLRDAPADAIGTLPAGIYIVNGSTAVIR